MEPSSTGRRIPLVEDDFLLAETCVAMMLHIGGPLVDAATLHEWSGRREVVELLEGARGLPPD